jgi:hypothetical protein
MRERLQILDSVVERATTGDYAEFFSRSDSTSEFLATILGRNVLVAIQDRLQKWPASYPEEHSERMTAVLGYVDKHLKHNPATPEDPPPGPRSDTTLIDYYLSFHSAGVSHTKDMVDSKFGPMAALTLFVGKFGIAPTIAIGPNGSLVTLRHDSMGRAIEIYSLNERLAYQYAVDAQLGITSFLTWTLSTPEGAVILTSAKSSDGDFLETMTKAPDPASAGDR